MIYLIILAIAYSVLFAYTEVLRLKERTEYNHTNNTIWHKLQTAHIIVCGIILIGLAIYNGYRPVITLDFVCLIMILWLVIWICNDEFMNYLKKKKIGELALQSGDPFKYIKLWHKATALILLIIVKLIL